MNLRKMILFFLLSLRKGTANHWKRNSIRARLFNRNLTPIKELNDPKTVKKGVDYMAKKTNKSNSSSNRQRRRVTFFRPTSSSFTKSQKKRIKKLFIKTISIILSLAAVITIYCWINEFNSEVVTATYVAGAFGLYCDLQKYIESTLLDYFVNK